MPNYGRCCICGDPPHSPILSFYRFPKDEDLSDQWAQNIGQAAIIQKSVTMRHKSLRVCSHHFENKMFSLHLVGTRLKRDAVPTLFKTDQASAKELTLLRESISFIDELPSTSGEGSELNKVPLQKEPLFISSEVELGSIESEEDVIDLTGADVEDEDESNEDDHSYFKPGEIPQEELPVEKSVASVQTSIKLLLSSPRIKQYRVALKALKRKLTHMQQIKGERVRTPRGRGVTTLEDCWNNKMPKCCVPDCPGTGTILYRFPIPDWETRTIKVWVERIGSNLLYGLSDSKIYMSYRVCDLHFSEHCRVADKTRLKKGSLPTLFLPGFSGESNAITSQIDAVLKLQDTQNGLSEGNDIKSEAVPPVPVENRKPFFKTVKSLCRDSEEISEVCRVCFLPCKNNDFMKLYEQENLEEIEQIKNMLAQILPDLNLEMYPNSVICHKCKDVVVSSFELRETCKATEEKLKQIIENEKQIIINHNADLIIVEETPGARELGDHNYAQKTKQKVVSHSVSLADDSLVLNPVNHNNKSQDGRLRGTIWGAGPYLCDICGSCMTKLGTFRTHLHRHGFGKSKPRPSMCDICGKIFKSMNDLNKHSRRHQGPHKCHLCNETFITATKLLSHNKQHHSQRNHQCHFCGKIVKSRAVLRTHLLTHGGKKRFLCQICNKRFLFKNGLNRHIYTHSNFKLLKCQFCDKFVKHKWSLKAHVKAYHSNTWKNTCEDCNRRFWSKPSLIRHRIVIHGWDGHSRVVPTD